MTCFCSPGERERNVQSDLRLHLIYVMAVCAAAVWLAVNHRGGGGGDGWWWLRDDEETMRRLTHSPLRGGLPRSHSNLWFTSEAPPPPPPPPRRHILTGEFRNVRLRFLFWGWTETLNAVKKKSFSHRVFLSFTFYNTPTTGAHAPPPLCNHKL